MALPMLVNNAECGPSNPLQGLSKRFDHDRGVLQDRVVAGSSRESFRSHPAQNAVDQDAARFFGSGQSQAFNFTSMATSLPSINAPQQHQQPQMASAEWANDFLLHHQQTPVAQMEKHTPNITVASPGPAPQMAAQPWNTGMLVQGPSFIPQHPVHQQQPNHVDQTVWDREFETQAQSMSASATQQIENQASYIEQDDLARTAGMLLETIKDSQNPKFQNSAFMGLMEQLRDRKVVVEGNQMVENTDTSYAPGSTSSKGKGRAIDPIAHTQPLSNGMQPQSQFIPNHSSLLHPDELDEYLRQENADYTRFWSDVNHTKGVSNPESEWDHMQQDWDNFEATATGIRPVDAYQFQYNNPYMVGESTRTRNHSIHANSPSSILESVLELEAIVQRDPSNAKAWYDLGVKQQENEREQKALQALSMAVELDPNHLGSWLALAVSHTNDGDRAGTFTAVHEWAKRNTIYADLARPHLQNLSEHLSSWDFNDSRHLVDCLMSMVRAGMAGGIDADVQIALGVLFNSNEDYDKAQDCFRTALAVRPEDWLLYNRVGATMANNGHAVDALEYYYRALEMNPSYVRARFNLGISCITLKRYQEAADHILDALVLQESDAAPDVDKLNDRRGLMSRALWDSLKMTCLHLQRLDLAIMCDQRDLEGFRERFMSGDV